MNEQDDVTYIFTWHCLSDACPKCQALNGREWRDQDLFQNRLWDPFYGDIWDLNTNQSLAHSNCRCQLEVRVIVNPRVPEEAELRNILSQLIW